MLEQTPQWLQVRHGDGQVLGARFAVLEGAASGLDQAVSEAQLLLLDLNFDGTGSYLGPPMASLERDKAGELTEQLTSYNNGELSR